VLVILLGQRFLAMLAVLSLLHSVAVLVISLCSRILQDGDCAVTLFVLQ
jgi:hypothetical protein